MLYLGIGSDSSVALFSEISLRYLQWENSDERATFSKKSAISSSIAFLLLGLVPNLNMLIHKVLFAFCSDSLSSLLLHL